MQVMGGCKRQDGALVLLSGDGPECVEADLGVGVGKQSKGLSVEGEAGGLVISPLVTWGGGCDIRCDPTLR